MILLYEVESRIHAYQAVRLTWFQKGKQKQGPTFGYHASVSLFGAVNVLNGDFLCHVADNCKVSAFLAFLKDAPKQILKRIVGVHMPDY